MGDFFVDYDKMKTPAQMRLEEVNEAIARRAKFKDTDIAPLQEHSAHMNNILAEQQISNIRERKEKEKKKLKKFQEFSSLVKANLVSESLAIVFDKVAESLQFTDTHKAVGHKMIESMVAEEGAESMINNFATKNVYLSSFAEAIDRFHKAIVESKKAECSDDCEDDICFSFDKEFASSFVDTIASATPAKASKVISDRVEKAVTAFVDQNTENKILIKGIYTKAKAKIDGAKDDSIKEDYNRMARAAVAKVNTSPTNLYGLMVREMAISVMKTPELKQVYTAENGSLNMGKLFNDTEVLYTVIETANTLGVIDVNRDYIRKIVSDIREN